MTTEERKNRLRRMLNNEREKHVASAREIRGRLVDTAKAQKEVGDLEEFAQAEVSSADTVALIRLADANVRRADQALYRLEMNKYGTCEDCEDPIQEKRLKAVPFATLCRECQEKHEGQRAYVHSGIEPEPA